MEKWLCWASMGVAGILLVLFLLDLVLLFVGSTFLPFGGISMVVDIICVLASGLLAFLAWDAYKEVK